MTEFDNILNKVFSFFSPHCIPDKNFGCQILSDFFEFFGALESDKNKVFRFQLMSDSVSKAQIDVTGMFRNLEKVDSIPRNLTEYGRN